ncbi:type II toxin-antitoxin system RelE family toxin [Rubrivirga sp.]|uniref:type II toxin-antitoxin system RelE family toxin n=1 Tax=Rubrivirga sp. TaxID=1885344 RepID=UPI003B51881D
MNHFATPSFWSAYRALPGEVQSVADKNFDLLKNNPRHPSLRLKKVGAFWSARVGRNHRAVARDRSEGLVWFWIGPHAQYDRLIG